MSSTGSRTWYATLYWRDGEDPRLLARLRGGRDDPDSGTGRSRILTVSLIDSLIFARSGFNHSADYRSVVVIGVRRRPSPATTRPARSTPSWTRSCPDVRPPSAR